MVSPDVDTGRRCDDCGKFGSKGKPIVKYRFSMPGKPEFVCLVCHDLRDEEIARQWDAMDDDYLYGEEAR